MDLPRAQWLSGLEADGTAPINQWEMKFINNSVSNLGFSHYSSESYSAYPSSSTESNIQEGFRSGMASSVKEMKNNNLPAVISFGDSNSPNSSTRDLCGKPKCTFKTEEEIMSIGEMNFSAQYYETLEYGETKRGCNRTPLQAKEHVLAERKRREKLSGRFVTLSAMIPGLKKLNKASVLEGAIKYLDHLEERIKMLEDEKRKLEESIDISSLSKRPRLASPGETSSSDENSDITLDQSSPEIEVRTSERNVLISIFCEKRKGIINEILGEIEKLHLGIISSSIIPLGTTLLNITIIAQMDTEVSMSAKDIANTIRMAMRKLM